MPEHYKILREPGNEINKVTDSDGWYVLASPDNCHMIADRLNEQHAEILRLRNPLTSEELVDEHDD